MNFPSDLNPCWLFLIGDVLHFPPLRRKLVFSFMKRIRKYPMCYFQTHIIFNDKSYAKILE